MSNLLPISAAFEKVTGSRPHPSTICRYVLRGCNGIRLESWMVGGLRKTTVEAVERFIQQRTAQSTPAMPNADLATSAAMADDPRRRTVAAMQERLREKGIALKTGADLESDQADGVAK